MKKFRLCFILSTLFYVAISQPSSLTCKTSVDEIEQLNTWHYLLGFENGNSVFLWSDNHRSKLFMKSFDKDTKLLLEKEIWALNSKKNGKVEISSIFEINNNLVFFMSFRTREDIKFFKLIIDPKTGEKISEEEIAVYVGLDHNDIEFDNYFFNFTKNDLAKEYYLMTFVRTKDGNSELKIFTYTYEHNQLANFSKIINKPYNSVDLIASIQYNKEYYFTINYVQRTGKDNKEKKQQVILYYFSNGILEELPVTINKNSIHYSSYISGQFSANQNGQIKFALANSYEYGDDYDKPIASDVYILTLSKDPFILTNKREISHTKLLNACKDINNVKAKDRAFVFNVPVSFYSNYNNQDELIFQSYKTYKRPNVVEFKTEDIALFTFDDSTNISAVNLIPFKLDGLPLKSFSFNSTTNGNTSNYYGFSPYPAILKYFNNISQKDGLFIFYNDLIENLTTLDRNNAKEFGRTKDIAGMYAKVNKSGIQKSLIVSSDPPVYFDFSSSSFNQKNGIYSVISIDGFKKIHISYISFN